VAIRAFRPGDHESAAVIFARAVHELGRQHYSEAQCLAWSARRPDPEHWRGRCARKRPWIAELAGEVAGILELDPDGHIDCAYVNPDLARRGVMTALVRHAVGVAREAGCGRVYVEASRGIRSLFEKEGFRVTERRLVRIGEEQLENFAMERRLSPAGD